jgi:hypothetical protein
MRLTKTLIAAAIATTVAGSAMAGGLNVTVVEPPVIMIEEPAGSSWGWVVPVVALAALAALALSED